MQCKTKAGFGPLHTNPDIFETTYFFNNKHEITEVFTSPGDIAEAFNNRFTNIGQSLAQEIPSLEIDPLAYVNPFDGVFSFQRINVQKVIKLFNAIDVGKATGLDKNSKQASEECCRCCRGLFNGHLLINR